ncbi:MAG: gamma-glutamylcyclotransferase [Anaerolineae bacterium]
MFHLEQVFVYGTLRPPRSDTPPADSYYHPYIAAHVLQAAPAYLPQADLYDLGPYPAARPGTGLVCGDLLTVAPEALAVMDRIEGHPACFYRRRVRVYLENGPVEAWIYWGPAPATAGRPRIAGGDWFQRRLEAVGPAANSGA